MNPELLVRRNLSRLSYDHDKGGRALTAEPPTGIGAL